jgi:hypothetical protein
MRRSSSRIAPCGTAWQLARRALQHPPEPDSRQSTFTGGGALQVLESTPEEEPVWTFGESSGQHAGEDIYGDDYDEPAPGQDESESAYGQDGSLASPGHYEGRVGAHDVKSGDPYL